MISPALALLGELIFEQALEIPWTSVTLPMTPLWQLSIVAVGFHIFRTLEVNRLMGMLLQQPDVYADFEFLAFWQTQYNNMNAVNLFFAWIKVPGTCIPARSPRLSPGWISFFSSHLLPPVASVFSWSILCFSPFLLHLFPHGPCRYSSTSVSTRP